MPMLNTQKFLYIFPDSTCVAEVLPTKKEHVFSIQSFRQINGEFINDEDFIEANIEKLMAKIEPEEYVLVLPDFLFTNTIVSVESSSDTAAKKHVREQILPTLEMSEETHQIFIEVLTKHNGKTKLQLSAIEHEVLLPLLKSASTHKIKLSAVVPLSWSIKSLVSLEPSITIIQFGNSLYTALQYIGVDQTVSFPVDQIDHVVESMKTLKGCEPSVQTVYLLTNDLVESELKEKLSNTLPLQQLSTSREKDPQIPPHVSQTIASCARTLDISDFVVPRFVNTLAQSSDEVLGSDLPQPSISPNLISTPISTSPSITTPISSSASITTPIVELPPTLVASPTSPESSISSQLAHEVESDNTLKSVGSIDLVEQIRASKDSEKTEIIATDSIVVSVEPPKTDSIQLNSLQTTLVAPSPKSTQEVVQSSTVSNDSVIVDKNAKIETTAISFVEPPIETKMATVEVQKGDSMSSYDNNSFSIDSDKKMDEAPKLSERPVLKNKSDMGGLLKVIGITLGALVVTVGIGVGLGMALLSFSERGSKNIVTPIVESSPKPIVQESPDLEPTPAASSELSDSPTPSSKPSGSPKPTPKASASPKVTASPTASASPNTLRSTSKVFIVNATKTAGVAGKLKDLLVAAGYKSVSTGNAKGQYAEPGMFGLTSKANPTLITDLEKTGELSFGSTTQEKKIEDPDEKYDVVIVINE